MKSNKSMKVTVIVVCVRSVASTYIRSLQHITRVHPTRFPASNLGRLQSCSVESVCTDSNSANDGDGWGPRQRGL